MECALKYLCREDLIAKLNASEEADGGDAENAEDKAAGPTCDEDEIETLLYCVNAVEDELARYYFPLKTSENFNSENKIYPFENFAKRAVKVLSVTDGEKPVNFKVFPKYLYADARNVCVEYEYSPDKKSVDDDSEYDGVAVGASLIAKGAASEFCIICGEMSLAELWESKYRQEIDLARKKVTVCGTLPPRRWV